MILAYVKLPHAGLGNMLLPWARAVAFCHKVGAKMIAPRWVQLPHIGPWLRGERYKRVYWTCFNSEGCVSGIWGLLFKFLFRQLDEAAITSTMKNCVVSFSGFGGNKGFFESLGDTQLVIKECLWGITNSNITAAVDSEQIGPGDIGVHVRRGDFATLGIAADDDWYIRAIKKAIKIRKVKGSINLFSDAEPKDLAQIVNSFPEEKVIIRPKASAIHDILLLSRFPVLITSPESTFSMWAVFLGQMPAVFKVGTQEHGVYAADSLAIFV